MEYKKGNAYNMIYVDKEGNQKEEYYSPEEDTNIAGMINGFKEITNDFFKLIKIDESKKIEEDIEKQYKTLFELIEGNDEGIDIRDNINNDLCVYYEFQNDDSDAYDKFLTKMAKELELISYDNKIAIVNMTNYVANHFDLLDSVFDITGENKEDEISELVSFGMEGIISGALSESTYETLLKEDKLTEENNHILNSDLQMEVYEMIQAGIFDEQSLESNIEITFEEIKNQFSDKIDVSDEDLKNYIRLKAEELYEDLKELELADKKTESKEDPKETEANIEEVVDTVDDITKTDMLAVETTNSSIDVLIADEKSAIDGYKAFLTQAKDTIRISPLYEVLETEIDEIIKDEEDHIKKLEAIKNAYRLEDLPVVAEQLT